MRRFVARWGWRLDSPLHCGSGISRPGVADRLVYRDQDDRIVIPGEAVKGALRMSAEQLISWVRGTPELYEPRQSTEPRLVPLAHLFGGNGGAHFTAGTPTGAVAQTAMLRSGTRIARATGTAADTSLRTIETLAPGCSFDVGFWVEVPESDFDAVETLFVGALSATESIGAKAGIGWGRVSLTYLTINGEETSGTTSITTARLDRLRNSLVPLPNTARSEAPATVSLPAPHFAWYELAIDLLEPACFSVKPEIANKVATEWSISATTLRGALVARWQRTGVGEALVHQRLSAGSRWLPAFPEYDGHLCAPAPRSLYVDKRATSSFGREPVYDNIGDRAFPSVAEAAQPKLRPAANAWVFAENGRPRFLPTDRRSATRMHTARRYTTGGKAIGALYARESVLPPSQQLPAKSAPQTRYISAAYVPYGTWSDGDRFEVLFGKRKSAGNGRALVTVRLVAGPPAFASRPGEETSQDVYIELLTPAIVRDARGHPVRSLSPGYWTALLEKALRQSVHVEPESIGLARGEVSRRSTATGRRGGWMSTWKQPRAAVTTIDAGSCWRLRCTDVAQAAIVRQALRHNQDLRQIGERRHEGFGWIAVDPAWSGYLRSPEEELDVRSKPQLPLPSPWPGCEDVERSELDAVVNRLNLDFRNDSKELALARGPLQQLAQLARAATHPEDCDAVRALCVRMADERQRDAWAALKAGTKARGLLDKCWAEPSPGNTGRRQPDLLRFTLEALLVRAKGGDEL